VLPFLAVKFFTVHVRVYMEAGAGGESRGERRAPSRTGRDAERPPPTAPGGMGARGQGPGNGGSLAYRGPRRNARTLSRRNLVQTQGGHTLKHRERKADTHDTRNPVGMTV